MPVIYGDEVELTHGEHVQQRRQRHTGKRQEPDQVSDQQDGAAIPAVGIDADNQSEKQEG